MKETVLVMAKTYKKGSKGIVVKQIQTALGITADGVFGLNTELAVKKFQKDNGLTVDGIVGNKTLNLLLQNKNQVSKMNTSNNLVGSIVSAISTGLAGANKLTNSTTTTDSGLVIENYLLPKDQYVNGIYKNDYIILHHTAGHDSPYQVIDGWSKDSSGRIATEFVIGGQRSTDGRNTYDGKILRAYPEKNQAYHIGQCGSTYMSLHSVGIEMCNIGWVKNGKSYVNSKVIPTQMITLQSPFRGYTQWHKYSDEQLKSLHKLLLYIANRDNIDLHIGLYEWIKKEGATKAFDYHQDAYMGNKKGLLSHTSIRKDKFDVSPQPELVDLILSL